MSDLIMDTNFYMENLSLNRTGDINIKPTFLNLWEITSSQNITSHKLNQRDKIKNACIKILLFNASPIKYHPLIFLLNDNAKNIVKQKNEETYNHLISILPQIISGDIDFLRVKFFTQSAFEGRSEIAAHLNSWLHCYISQFDYEERLGQLEDKELMKTNVKDIIISIAKKSLPVTQPELRSFGEDIISTCIDWDKVQLAVDSTAVFLHNKLDKNYIDDSKPNVKANDINDFLMLLYLTEEKMLYFTDEIKWRNRIKSAGYSNRLVERL